MTPPPVTVLIEYHALPGQVERAVAELERLIATVVTEETDCLAIRLLQDPADPSRLLLHEQWTSQEAYLGPHFQTAYLQDFIARGAAFLAGPPSIQFWRVLSNHLSGQGARGRSKL
jgi:quinol monooxygenase YgiN